MTATTSDWLETFSELERLPEDKPTRKPAVTPAASVGWFNPTQAASILVADQAAEYWAQEADEKLDYALQALNDAGCSALILAGALPVFEAASQSFRGRRYRYRGSAAELIFQFRRRPPAVDSLTGVHGVLVQVRGLGVLIQGKSGSGKSELALELVARGHTLIADDHVELQRISPQCLIGHAPQLLAGFIEVRGLGILDVPAMYGPRAFQPRARVDLIANLDGHKDISTESTRLAGHRNEQELLGRRIPCVYPSRRLGHNLAVIIEAACLDHWLRTTGYHADRQMMSRHDQVLGVTRDGSWT